MVQGVFFHACLQTFPLEVELAGARAWTALADAAQQLSKVVILVDILSRSGWRFWFFDQSWFCPYTNHSSMFFFLDLSRWRYTEPLLCACHNSPCWILETQIGTDRNPVINE